MAFDLKEGIELGSEGIELVVGLIKRWEATVDEPGVEKDEAILQFVLTELPAIYKFGKKVVAEGKD